MRLFFFHKLRDNNAPLTPHERVLQARARVQNAAKKINDQSIPDINVTANRLLSLFIIGLIAGIFPNFFKSLGKESLSIARLYMRLKKSMK